MAFRASKNLVVAKFARKKVFFCEAFSYTAKRDDWLSHTREFVPKIRWKTCLRTILGIGSRMLSASFCRVFGLEAYL